MSVTVRKLREKFGWHNSEMLTDFFWGELVDIDLEDVWFQQDAATCHTARETMQLLQTKFSGQVISRFGDHNWPPRSCDLTLLDFFLWGFLKSKVYANNPQTIAELKAAIRRHIDEIRPHICHHVIQNFVKRADTCRRGLGGHLSDILFHT